MLVSKDTTMFPAITHHLQQSMRLSFLLKDFLNWSFQGPLKRNITRSGSNEGSISVSQQEALNLTEPTFLYQLLNDVMLMTTSSKVMYYVINVCNSYCRMADMTSIVDDHWDIKMWSLQVSGRVLFPATGMLESLLASGTLLLSAEHSSQLQLCTISIASPIILPQKVCVSNFPRWGSGLCKDTCRLQACQFIAWSAQKRSGDIFQSLCSSTKMMNKAARYWGPPGGCNDAKACIGGSLGMSGAGTWCMMHQVMLQIWKKRQWTVSDIPTQLPQLDRVVFLIVF